MQFEIQPESGRTKEDLMMPNYYTNNLSQVKVTFMIEDPKIMGEFQGFGNVLGPGIGP